MALAIGSLIDHRNILIKLAKSLPLVPQDPVADALGGTGAYPDLDLLRLHYLCRNPHRIPGEGSLQEGDSQQGARE